MLPQLQKKRAEPHKSSFDKLPGQFPENRSQIELQNNKDRDYNNLKSMSSKKARTGGGFNKYPAQEAYGAKNQPNFMKNFNSGNNDSKYAKFQRLKASESNLGAEIKMIQRKIKACQKKLELQKKKQKLRVEQATRDKSEPMYDFEQVVQRQLQMQGYYQIKEDENQKNFDYLTNPGGRPKQQPEQQQPVQQIQVAPKPYSIENGIQKLQKHYENNLKRKFERRQMFPHQACKRKTPKLYISHKTNSLNKYGKAANDTEHMFRVYTKETTPQQIYPTIPNFALVKDNLSKNIVAYLGDYKPFLDKTKQKKNEVQQESAQQDKQSNGHFGYDSKLSDNNSSKYQSRQRQRGRGTQAEINMAA